jgi:hypothetical protein
LGGGGKGGGGGGGGGGKDFRFVSVEAVVLRKELQEKAIYRLHRNE